MNNILVFSKTEIVLVDIDNGYDDNIQLTPLVARRASLAADCIPCFVTDGNLVYRVTKRCIRLWEKERLRYRDWQVINIWLQTGIAQKELLP